MVVMDREETPLLQEDSMQAPAEDGTDESILEPEECLKLLGEVVGGYQLASSKLDASLAADNCNNSSSFIQPYCIIRLGDRTIHQTKPSTDGGLNPIWTITTGSTFLLEVTPQQVVEQQLDLSVWYEHKDPLLLGMVEKNCLGNAQVDLSEILAHHCDEERIDVELLSERSRSSSLTLRFRLATPSDVHFLNLLNQSPGLLKKKTTSSTVDDATSSSRDVAGGLVSTNATTSLLVTEANETKVAGESFLKTFSSAFTSRTKRDVTSGQDKVLVKPGPDPARPKETTYLSPQEIRTETLSPSHQWIEAGSGNMGKVYLEILSCHDLPNVDVGEAVGNVTDAFICAVFEDVLVQTPVIDDELSPHFLPWTQRAFVLKMTHPCSMLYLATFDYDLGITAHEALGRVVVNIGSFHRDTDYTLTYNLYPSTNVTDRTAAGSITIRLRVEYEDEKEALLAALTPRPKFHINVRREKSLSVLRYTCFGEYGDSSEQPFDLTVSRSYVNEIFEYKRMMSYCVGDALRSLVFWRGQVKVGKHVALPVHSMLFFCFATTLVERPYLFPSFFLLSVAWIMLASHTLRLQHPSPWHRCHSFWHYFNILRHGKSFPSANTIVPNQGSTEADAYEKQWQDRVEKDLDFANKQYEMQQELLNLGDEAIHTKTANGMIPLDMFARLTRYQGILGRLCIKFRVVKIILTWEETYLSFWITACFLAGGVVSLLLPWAFILCWTSRIVVWGLFGPHMKLVDWTLHAKGKDEDVLEKAMENFRKESHTARLRRQEAVKLKDMKTLVFGKHIARVPQYNLSRHYDRPLHASYASVHDPEARMIRIAPFGIPGQRFFGVILPRTEAEELIHKEEVSKLEKFQRKVQKCIERMKHPEQQQEEEEANKTERFREESIPSEIGVEISCDDAAKVAQASEDASSKVYGHVQEQQAEIDDPDDSGSVVSEADARYSNGSSLLTKPVDMNRTQSWSAGDGSLSSLPTKKSRRLTIRPDVIVEVDEERETDEIEVVLGSFSRDGAPADDKLDFVDGETVFS